jgi:CRISPR-associated protein Csd2
VNRHDILIFFDVTNGNPNGDPDAGNMPRIEPNTGKGLVSDVCLKRKVRNFVALFAPTPDGDSGNRFGILVQQGNILNTEIKKGIDASAGPPAEVKEAKGKKVGKDDGKAEAAMKWLCQAFYDVRTFGGVLSTGDDVMKGSAYGQVRGPVQFTFGMSLDPIPMQEITVTRCAVTKEEDAAKERTMGNKHIVPYGLYCAKAFVSPIFAERTGFDEADLKLFFDALAHLFRDDASAARAEMCVRAVYDFEHVGTQDGKNAAQNRREQQLGCEHAHRLFEKVGFKRKPSERTFPAGFEDYEPVDGWREKKDELPKGVKLNRIVDPKPKDNEKPDGMQT